MDLTNVAYLKSLLSRFGIHPSPQRGQHFLIDRKTLQTITTAAELEETDVVLEIGAGVGTLTSELAAVCRLVLAIELDRRLIPALHFVLKQHDNVKIYQEDILRADIGTLLSAVEPRDDYKLVANIPYAITGQILRLFLSSPLQPRMMVLLVQKEVGERIVATPGNMSVLSVSVQVYGRPEIVSIVPRDHFFPAPAVDSAIVKIERYDHARFEGDEKAFFRLVKIGFAARRKTLLNNLAAGYHMRKEDVGALLKRAGIGAEQRAQELDINQWHRLYTFLEQ